MNHWPGQVVLHILFYCFFAVTGANASPDSTTLPSSLSQVLATYKQQNDLESWIYARIMYTEKDPYNRIGFLMHTEQDAWRSYNTYYERLAWFDLLAVQGYFQLQIGNILSSISAYETALQFYESYPLPDINIIETVLKPLGNNYTRLADYSTALFIHRKTLALAQKQNDRNAIASAYSNMAICARWQGDLSSALAYCQTGFHYTSHNRALYGLLLSTLADILSEQGRYDTAHMVCLAAIQQLKNFKSDAASIAWYAGALGIGAQINILLHKYEQAAAYAKQALQIYRHYYPKARQREKARIQVLLGDLYNQTGNARQAVSYYQQALLLMMPTWKPASLNETPANNLLYSESTLCDALFGKAAALAQERQPQSSLQHYITAFVAESKLRKQFFYNDSKLKELQVTRSRIDAAMKLAYRLFTNSGNREFENDMLLIAEMSRAQVLMDERRSGAALPGTFKASDSLWRKAKRLQQAIGYYQHELLNTTDKRTITNLLQQTEYELSLLHKKMQTQAAADTKENAPLTVQQLNNIWQQIPNRVSMLEFFAGADTSFIIELNNEGIQKVYVVNSSGDLQNNINRFMHTWFANGPGAMMNEPASFYKECYDIYQALFKNMPWNKQRHYILVPDGAFNYLPFDALITDAAYRNNFAQWPYLIKQVSLSQAYSLQTWYEQQQAHYTSSAFTGFFVAKGKAVKQPVLSIEEEYRHMQTTINGRFYSNNTATWNAFNTVSDSTGILHISTHAVSSASDSFPYLQLYDKPFYLFDLRYKHFSPALVVLSACKTADGLLLEGEGLNSIGRGFTAAGAGGVVSGLWNVNDQTAIALLQLFYEQLPQQPNAGAALHQAKLQWLQPRKESAMLQLPYYWAGFVYSGHLQKIQPPMVSTSGWYYWAAALLVAVIILLFLAKVFFQRLWNRNKKGRP